MNFFFSKLLRGYENEPREVKTKVVAFLWGLIFSVVINILCMLFAIFSESNYYLLASNL